MNIQQPQRSPFIRVAEIAKLLGKSKNHVYLLLDNGVIPSVPYGYGERRRRRLILREEFDRFIRGRSQHDTRN